MRRRATSKVEREVSQPLVTYNPLEEPFVPGDGQGEVAEVWGIGTGKILTHGNSSFKQR